MTVLQKFEVKSLCFVVDIEQKWGSLSLRCLREREQAR